MRTQANKISDNGNLDIYNDKNIRKLLTFDRDTTTISIEGNESKPRPTGQKMAHPSQSRSMAVQHFCFQTSNYTTKHGKPEPQPPEGWQTYILRNFRTVNLKWLIRNAGGVEDSLIKYDSNFLRSMLICKCPVDSPWTVRRCVQWTVCGTSTEMSADCP